MDKAMHINVYQYLNCLLLKIKILTTILLSFLVLLSLHLLSCMPAFIKKKKIPSPIFSPSTPYAFFLTMKNC